MISWAESSPLMTDVTYETTGLSWCILQKQSHCLMWLLQSTGQSVTQLQHDCSGVRAKGWILPEDHCELIWICFYGLIKSFYLVAFLNDTNTWTANGDLVWMYGYSIFTHISQNVMLRISLSSGMSKIWLGAQLQPVVKLYTASRPLLLNGL